MGQSQARVRVRVQVRERVILERRPLFLTVLTMIEVKRRSMQSNSLTAMDSPPTVKLSMTFGCKQDGAFPSSVWWWSHEP